MSRSGWFPRSLAIVLRDVGGIQLLVGLGMFVPVLVAVPYREPHAGAALTAGGAITSLVGGLLYWTFQDAPEPKRRHALVIAGGGWLAVAIFGALPYLFAAYWTPDAVAAALVPAGAGYPSSLHAFRDPMHALFESMSGYTTTGLTMTVHEPTLPHALLFYRSWTQWVGGAGVLVLALAVLRSAATVGGYSLYASEARSKRVRPSAIGTAREIWRIYLGLTLAVAAYLAAVLFLAQPGMGVERTLFDAVNHAMTGQSTGGFSTMDDSIAGYASYAVELAHVPPMVLGAIAFPVYYAALKNRDLRELTEDPQVRTLFGLLVIGIPTTAFLLSQATFDPGPLPGGLLPAAAEILQTQAVRDGIFQYASALTGTGWQTSPIGTWDGTASLFVVAFAMNVGGCAGATTGGIKLLRALVLAKGIRWEATRAFLPENAVQSIEVGDFRLEQEEIDAELRQAGMLVLAYVAALTLAAILLIPVFGDAGRPVDVIFEVASAQGTVGLSTGLTGPGMPRLAEGAFVFLMWLGRLEIFPVLAFLRAVRHGMRFR